MKRNFFIFAIILAIVVFFFRSYLFGGKLLFPTNLLAAYYSPWNTESYPGWEHGIPFKGLGHDNLLIFYPMKTLLRKAMSEHALPLWTPYNFAGGPVFGDGQSAPMYPFTYLYLFPSLPDAFSLMVILVPTLTMLFTYGMLRHFKLSPLASLFGAVAFAFSGFMSVWMEENPAVSQSAIWLPLLVWMLDLLITQPKRRWFAAFAVSVAIMMSSGFLQICIYELLFIAAYALVFGRKRLGLIILAVLAGLLLVAPYLAVTWEAYKLSPRDVVAVPEIRSIFLVQWSHILSLFNPDWLGNPGTYNFFGIGSYYDKALFIGVIPLVFVVIGLFAKKTLWEKFFWWAAGITLFLGISSPFTQWLFGLPIPVLSSMLPSRIFYLTSFALAVIAARVFDRKPQLPQPAIGVYLAIVILLELFIVAVYTEVGLPTFPAGAIAHSLRTAIASGMHVSESYPTIAIRNIMVSIILTLFTMISLYAADKWKRVRVAIPILLFLATIASAWYFTGKSLYFGERQFIYPDIPLTRQLQKTAGLERIGFANHLSRIPSGTNIVYGLYSPEGLNPVFSLRYGQLMRSAINGGLLTNDIPRISVELDLEHANKDAGTARRIKKLMSLLHMKYIVEKKESGWYKRVFPNHTVVWEGTYFRIWENPDTLPRAFVATAVIVEKDPQKIVDAIYSIDLRKTAVVEEPMTVSPGTNAVTVDTYRMNDITMSVHSSSDGLLVLTDNWAPGWRAKVDGNQTPVYRTDFTFRGVPVPAGDHKVFMYYWPDSLTYGLWAMGGGILLLAGSLLIIRWKNLSR